IPRPVQRAGSTRQVRKLLVTRTVNVYDLHLSENNMHRSPTFVRTVCNLLPVGRPYGIGCCNQSSRLRLWRVKNKNIFVWGRETSRPNFKDELPDFETPKSRTGLAYSSFEEKRYQHQQKRQKLQLFHGAHYLIASGQEKTPLFPRKLPWGLLTTPK